MSKVVHEFTATVPRWAPYVTPVELDKATPEQREAMQITPSSKGISPYVLTLAHDPESLKVRSPLFNMIMYGKGGLSSAERELGAVAASIVNACVYCVAVHASRFNQLTKRPEVMDTIFAAGAGAELEDHHQADLRFRGEALAVAAGRRGRRNRGAARHRPVGGRDPRLDPVGLDLRLGQPADAYAGRAGH